MDALLLTDLLNDGFDGIVELRTNKDFKALFPKTKDKFVSEVLKFASRNKSVQKEFSTFSINAYKNMDTFFDFWVDYHTYGTSNYVVNIIAEALGINYDECYELVYETYMLDNSTLTFDLVDILYNDESLTTDISIKLFMKYSKPKNTSMVVEHLFKFALKSF